MKQKVLIAGGSGFIGSYLSNYLNDKNYNCSTLTRNKNIVDGESSFYWNPDKEEIDIDAFTDVDFLINLAGAGIADKRWTNKRKKEIRSSRVNATKFLFSSISKYQVTLKKVISSSATGIYGHRPNENLSEQSSISSDFIGTLCNDWEQLALSGAQKSSIPISVVRIGYVLSTKSGALPIIAQQLKLGLNALINGGNYSVSWIHINDLARIFEWLLNHEPNNGVFNAISPNPVSQKVMNKALLQALNKKALEIYVPKAFLRILLGEMVDIITFDQVINPDVLLQNGFMFKYPEIDKALASFYG